MIIEKAHSPVYNDSDGNSITISVKFKHLPNEVLYVAMPNDVVEISRELYKNAIEGKYGTIKLFQHIPAIEEEISIEKITNQVLANRSRLLRESDGYCYKYYDKGEMIPLDLARYREALRDITEQTGYPTDVVWPIKPF